MKGRGGARALTYPEASHALCRLSRPVLSQCRPPASMGLSAAPPRQPLAASAYPPRQPPAVSWPVMPRAANAGLRRGEAGSSTEPVVRPGGPPADPSIQLSTRRPEAPEARGPAGRAQAGALDLGGPHVATMLIPASGPASRMVPRPRAGRGPSPGPWGPRGLRARARDASGAPAQTLGCVPGPEASLTTPSRRGYDAWEPLALWHGEC